MRIIRDGKLGIADANRFRMLAHQLKQDNRLARENGDKPSFYFTGTESDLMMQLADTAFGQGKAMDNAVVRITKSDDGNLLATATWDDGTQVVGAVAKGMVLRRLKRKITASEAKSMQWVTRAV